MEDERYDVSGFSKRLETLQEPYGLAGFAERIGKSPSTITQWKRGGSAPNLNAVIAIDKATGCGLEWLVYGRSQMPPINTELLFKAHKALADFLAKRNATITEESKIKYSVLFYIYCMENNIRVFTHNTINEWFVSAGLKQTLAEFDLSNP